MFFTQKLVFLPLLDEVAFDLLFEIRGKQSALTRSVYWDGWGISNICSVFFSPDGLFC